MALFTAATALLDGICACACAFCALRRCAAVVLCAVGCGRLWSD
jgi:hypothetical protein